MSIFNKILIYYIDIDIDIDIYYILYNIEI